MLAWSIDRPYGLGDRWNTSDKRHNNTQFNPLAVTYPPNSGKISGAHLNPAGSLAAALVGDLQWSMLPIYMAGQYLGGFLAALLLFINYAEAINSLDGGSRSAFGNGSLSTGSIFATYPADWVSVWGSLLDQIMGTAVLLFGLSSVADQKNYGLDKKQHPIYVALSVCATCVAFSPNCGAIFNPARDVAPRLLSFVVGYSEPSVWAPINHSYWLTAGLVGPHIGAILGVFAYRSLAHFWLSCCPNNDYQVESYNSQSHQRSQQSNITDLSQRTSDFTVNKGYPENISYGSAQMTP